MPRFISAPLTQLGDEFVTAPDGSAPPIPRAFTWKEGELHVIGVLRSWRSSKNDRGDTYLKRHWFELQTAGGLRIQIYYDREARKGASHWWLYTIE
ncbi:MAG TPA: DUF6504 family protein [Candidatus Baltobacteraceae bacterium]|nr:DUF6504 family protein [Candidatus Baltobacteraceae bacterium]